MERIKELYKHELAKFEIQKQNLKRLWNISARTAELLYSYVLLKNPKHILEIGTSNGYSTFWLSIAAERCDAVVDTIEIDKARFKLAKENLKTRTNITQRFGKAELIIPELKDQYDFVFIDASKINYIDYIQLLLNKLVDNAIIIADNAVSHEGSIKEYLDFMDSSEQFADVTLNIDSGLNAAIFKKVNTEETI